MYSSGIVLRVPARVPSAESPVWLNVPGTGAPVALAPPTRDDVSVSSSGSSGSTARQPCAGVVPVNGSSAPAERSVVSFVACQTVPLAIGSPPGSLDDEYLA